MNGYNVLSFIISKYLDQALLKHTPLFYALITIFIEQHIFSHAAATTE